MSIRQDLNRIEQAKISLRASIENKGVTVPIATKLDGYPAFVDQIEGGGVVGGAIEFTDIPVGAVEPVLLPTNWSESYFTASEYISLPILWVDLNQ